MSEDGRSKKGSGSAKQKLLVTTTEGRAKLPLLLQASLGDKAVIGFDRYGSSIGAIVPIEAVRMLAGFSDQVDEDVQNRVKRAAKAMLEQSPYETELLGIELADTDEFDEDDVEEPIPLDEVISERKASRRRKRVRGG